MIADRIADNLSTLIDWKKFHRQINNIAKFEIQDQIQRRVVICLCLLLWPILFVVKMLAFLLQALYIIPCVFIVILAFLFEAIIEFFVERWNAISSRDPDEED